jgi:hypothetical protein
MKYAKDFNVHFFDIRLQAKEILKIYLREY